MTDEQHIKFMHQGCPSHDSAFDEEDFLRIFGAGDEQQHKPRRYDQEQFDHGHTDKDF